MYMRRDTYVWSCMLRLFKLLRLTPRDFASSKCFWAANMPLTISSGRVDIDQSGVSRHLRILQEAGVRPRVRPDGPKRLYSLRPEPFRELGAWAMRYRNLWEGRLDKFGEELGRRQKARVAMRKERIS